MASRCDECTFEFDSPLLDQIHIIGRCPDQVDKLLEEAGDGVYRRPAAETWSPNEYVWHMVDLFHMFAEWLHMTRTQEHPTHAPLDADRLAELRGYNERPVETGIWALQSASALLIQEAAIANPTRIVVYKGWRDVTAGEVIGFAAHEAAHHLVDLKRAISADRLEGQAIRGAGHH